MTTLCGSHAIAGAAAAMSSLGSALAIAMMVGGVLGRPPWSRGLFILDPRTGSGTVLFGWKPLSTLNAQPPELKHGLLEHGPRVPLCYHETAYQEQDRPSGRARRHRGLELALSEDG